MEEELVDLSRKIMGEDDGRGRMMWKQCGRRRKFIYDTSHTLKGGRLYLAPPLWRIAGGQFEIIKEILMTVEERVIINLIRAWFCDQTTGRYAYLSLEGADWGEAGPKNYAGLDEVENLYLPVPEAKVACAEKLPFSCNGASNRSVIDSSLTACADRRLDDLKMVRQRQFSRYNIETQDLRA